MKNSFRLKKIYSKKKILIKLHKKQKYLLIPIKKAKTNDEIIENEIKLSYLEAEKKKAEKSKKNKLSITNKA